MRGRSGGVSSAWWHVRTAFEVCFVGLVVERICVWCLVIVFIFMGFGQAGAKMCGGMLISHQLGVVINSQKGGSFHRKGRFSLCNTAVLWNFIPSLTGYILWKILLDTSFHYTTVVLRVWGWQSQKCNSKCPNGINTKFCILNPPPSPCLFFSIIVFVL